MALSTGCSGCDASGVYATITQVIFNTNWYDDCDGIILENAVRSVKPGRVNESFVAYAYYKDGAPKAINNADLTWEVVSNGGTALNVASGVVSGGKAYAWIKPADGTGDQVRREVAGKSITVSAADDVEYCVMYKYTNDAAKQITVNAQFIPSVLHAVLTVALYYGDACNVEAATKAGEVTIDIPRLQLNGTLDLAMCTTCC